MTGFNFLDIIFLLIVCVFMLRGLWHGLIKEVGTIAALVIGLLCAYLFFQPVAALFIGWGLKFAAPVLAFIAVFAVTYLLITLIAYFLQDVIERIQLGSLNRIFGMMLGFLEGFIIVYILLTLITLQPLQAPKDFLNQSFSKYIIDNNLYSLTAYLDEVYARLLETVSRAAEGAAADV